MTEDYIRPSQRRTMIYRDDYLRALEDGCEACNGSKTWCDSLAPDDRCCSMCNHW